MPAATIDRVSRDLTVRTFEVREGTWRDQDRSFEAVLATEGRVLVMDMQRWEPVEEILVAKGCKVPKTRQVPLLDSHNRYSVRDGQVGSVREIRTEGGQVVARNYISSSEPNIATKVKEGHITDCSVGYRVVNSVVIEPGQTLEVNGQSYTASPTRALRVTTEWELKENSLCPIGADGDAKIREDAGSLPAQKEGHTMADPVVPAPAGAPATPPVAPAAAIVRAEAPKSEMSPAEALRRDVLAYAPPELEGFARGLLLQPDMTLEKARALMLAEFTKGKEKPVGTTDPEVGKRADGATKTPQAPTKIADVPDDVLRRSILG